MIIKNGHLARLVIAGVYDGMAGVLGNHVAFAPNRAGGSPRHVKGGLLDGQPVRLETKKDDIGPFFTSRFEVIA